MDHFNCRLIPVALLLFTLACSGSTPPDATVRIQLGANGWVADYLPADRASRVPSFFPVDIATGDLDTFLRALYARLDGSPKTNCQLILIQILDSGSDVTREYTRQSHCTPSG